MRSRIDELGSAWELLGWAFTAALATAIAVVVLAFAAHVAWEVLS